MARISFEQFSGGQPITNVTKPTGSQTTQTQQETPLANKVTDFLGLGGATKVFGDVLARQGIGTDTPKEVTQQYVQQPKASQVYGALAQTAAIPAGIALTGGSSLLGQAAIGAGLGYAYDVGSDLVEQKSLSDTLTPGFGTLAGAVAPGAVKVAGKALGLGASAVSKTLSKTGDAISSVAPGAIQIGKDIAERVPKTIQRAKGALDESAIKSARLDAASPATKVAIKSGLDDSLIQGVESADLATRSDFRQMVDIAETPSVGLRPKVRPESIAGNAASDQYNLIEKQRKLVGSEIGALSDQLGTKTTIDVNPIQRNVRDILRQNNILPDSSGQLRFNTKRLTDSQKAVVQKLYDTSMSDKVLSPKQVHEYDQLFSKMQREARFKDNVDDVYVSVPTETGTAEVNLFKVFRDIYSKQLDGLSPRMRELNREYRTVKNLQDDLDSSIFKSGNFETTKNLDGAEFAQTNLRRLFSDAQSAADYRAIYDSMDALSRNLGYQGARADELALFAAKLRKLYPEVVPETSFQGIMSSVADTIMTVGKPNAKDQQEALKMLLKESTK